MTDYVVEFDGWQTMSSLFTKKKRYTNTDLEHVLPQAKKDAIKINAEFITIYESKSTRYLGTWVKKNSRWYLSKD